MKLFKAEVRTKKKRHALEVIVHAGSIEAARSYLAGKFPGCVITGWIELDDVPKHFTIAEIEDEAPVDAGILHIGQELPEFTFSLELPKQQQDWDEISEGFERSRLFKAGELARFGYLGAAYVVAAVSNEEYGSTKVTVTVQAV